MWKNFVFLVLLPQPVKLYSRINSIKHMMVNIPSATALLLCEDVSSEKMIFSRIFMCLNKKKYSLEIFFGTEKGKSLITTENKVTLRSKLDAQTIRHIEKCAFF